MIHACRRHGGPARRGGLRGCGGGAAGRQRRLHGEHSDAMQTLNLRGCWRGSRHGCRRGCRRRRRRRRQPKTAIVVLLELARLAELGEVTLPYGLNRWLVDLSARPDGGPHRQDGRLEVWVGELAGHREGVLRRRPGPSQQRQARRRQRTMRAAVVFRGELGEMQTAWECNGGSSWILQTQRNLIIQ